MPAFFVPVIRWWANLRRNSAAASMRLMKRRNESTSDIHIREAGDADIPQLAAVHVKAWADTYFLVLKPPTIAIRERQWKEIFRQKDNTWFCYVVTNKEGTIIGFATGKTYQSDALPQFNGELNKIYLLFEYHRLGIGTRLLQTVAKRFLEMGINNMVLFSENTNPSGWFYEAMSARRLYDAKGKFHGGYAWEDLERLC